MILQLRSPKLLAHCEGVALYWSLDGCILSHDTLHKTNQICICQGGKHLHNWGGRGYQPTTQNNNNNNNTKTTTTTTTTKAYHLHVQMNLALASEQEEQLEGQLVIFTDDTFL